jgi:3-oxoacyl-[acyl-carrier-protein] synthase II
LLGRMDMIVAAGGGERDYAVDGAILTTLPNAEEGAADLNERLLNDLRPTLFLAQLSNLLAGNISIVHGVVGSSKTFMGEESAGADAVRIACARIAAGQGDLFLVGGAMNAERPDMLLLYEMGGMVWKQPFAAVWSRQVQGGGIVLGSVGCFLVVESRAHADARGARGLARIRSAATDRTARRPGQAIATAQAQWNRLLPHLRPDSAAILSGAAGAAAATIEEHEFLAATGLPFRATATAIGHSVEPSFVANLALAAVTLAHGEFFAPLEEAESPMTNPLKQVVVTSWGAWRGEAMALVDQAN